MIRLYIIRQYVTMPLSMIQNERDAVLDNTGEV